ncbi:AAA family ATPase [Actinomyces viscosus]|jgi:septum site-determining protein|uniref:AAA family ATPase n=2 Tax=Actinomyces TaxID=1654 RepID=A0ABT7TXD7_ACTVI|nr:MULTISPECIES: P-loop NTPase [Actinomyces]MDM8076250.1 AAA family ATPase [Actinomyces viscosus]MDR0181273.1 AAA family ATPase [Actinomyces oris]
MQYLVTDHEETRQQVLAAMSEAEGLGEVRTVASPEKLRELLEPEVTSCILVDEALEGRIALPIIQELSRTYPLIPVVLLSRARTSESVVAAMDAGARTVLALPLSLEEISNRLLPVLAWSRAVRSEASSREEITARRQGTITAVVGAKGGVGTSTVALMAAAQLAQGARTCLVDLDVRGGDLAAMTGISVRRSITDLADIAAEVSAREISEVMYPLPGGIALLPAPEQGETGEMLTESATRQILTMLRYQFDHVVLDCGNRLDDILAMGLDSADRALIVTTPDAPALRSVRRLSDALDRLDIARGRPFGLVVNLTSRQREIQPATAAKMTGVALAASIPDLTAQIEMAVNSNTLLTSRVPAMAKAAQSIAGAITAGTAPGPAPDQSAMAGSTKATRRGRKRRRSQRGQITVEFPVVFALATVAILLCIQALSLGISYMYATHAANEAAHAYAIGKSPGQVQQEVTSRLPNSYAARTKVTRSGADRVTVTLPVLSVVDMNTSASAGIVWEK